MKLVPILAVSLISGLLLSGCQGKAVPEKKVVEQQALYPAYTVETITNASTLIVHGVVSKKGESFIHYSETNDGDYIESVFTPYTIRVTDCLKGEADKTVIYNQRGGETEDAIYTVHDGGEVEKGEEVLLFLNEVNVSWGSQGVYRIENGNTQIENRMLPTSLYSEDDDMYSEISFADFKALVSDYINETEE